MADRYWVGGTAAWDGTAGTKWAATSGGAGGQTVPTAADNVFFDAASGANTVTVTGTRPCLSLNTTGFTGTLAGATTPILQISASLTIGAGTTIAGTLTTVSFVGNTATRTFTSSGKSFVNVSVATTSTNTLTLQDALTLTGTFTLTTGVLALSSYTLTAAIFDNTSSSARTIAFDTGKITLTGSGVVFNGNGTGLTSTGTTRTVEPRLTAAQTISPGTPTEANTFDVSVPASAGNFTLTLSSSSNFRNLTFANVTYTVANTALNIYGDVTFLGSTPVLTAGANSWTFAATGSVIQNITSNGETLDFPIIKGGSTTSTLRLQDALSMGLTRTLTLTSGILDLQSYTLTIGLFASSNSNVRSIAFGTGKIFLAGTATSTSWGSATGTNFTSSGTKLVEVTAPIGGSTKTLGFGTISEANTLDVSVISGGSTGTINITGNVRNLSFANATYTISDGAISIFGNLLISGTSPTFSGGTSVWTFAATGSTIQDITTSGEVLNFPITKGGSTTSTLRLQDSLTMNTGRAFTLTSGILDLQSYVLTTGDFSSSNSNVRSISFGTGKVITNAVSMATSTNFTSTGSRQIETINLSGSRTFSFGTGVTESNTLNLRIVAGGTTTTYTVTGRINNFYVEDTPATMSGTFGPTIYGDLFFGGTGSSIFFTSGSGTTTFAATSGTKSITTNGVIMECAVTFNGIGGTWQLQSNMTVGISFLTTLTAGAIDMNTYNLSTGRFALTASASARSINFHSNEITLTDGQGYFSPNFFTTLSMVGSGSLYSFSGSNIFNINPTASTLLINVNLSDTTLAPNIKISSGSEIFFNNPAKVNNLTLSAGSAAIRPQTQTNAPIDIYGNLLAESTWAGQFSATGDPSFNPPYYYNILDFKSSSGVKTITSNGKKIDAIIRFDNTSGSWRFEDDFAQNVQSTTNDFARYMDLSNGTVDLNGKIVAVNQFRRLTFGTVSTLTFGSGELRIISDDTAWPPSGSTYGPCYIDFNNTIINRDTGKISFSSSGRTTFLGGGSGAYANTIAPPLQQLSGSSNGLLIKVISAKLVIADLLGNVSNPSYFYFDPQTYYFDKFTLTAPVGQLARLLSNGGPGPTYSFVLNSGIANCQRLYVQDSLATPATNTWYAGSTSTNGGNNTGWIFADAPQASGNMLMLFA